MDRDTWAGTLVAMPEPVAVRSGALPDDVERLLRSLPDWFGMERSNREYVEDARHLPTYVVRDPDHDVVIGILLVKRHFPASAEVHLMAVDPAHHRQGVGRALVGAAETELKADGVRILQVKTLGESSPNEHYARTRQFYLALGFTPLEEFPELWDEGNPCLLLVKAM
jgi:GNAT superfamily N-acetyltransferase